MRKVKLTMEQKIEIVRLYFEGKEGKCSLARRYGIDESRTSAHEPFIRREMSAGDRSESQIPTGCIDLVQSPVHPRSHHLAGT